MASRITRTAFGLVDGVAVEKFVLGSKDVQVSLLSYGATLLSLQHLGEEVTLHFQGATDVDGTYVACPAQLAAGALSASARRPLATHSLLRLTPFA